MIQIPKKGFEREMKSEGQEKGGKDIIYVNIIYTEREREREREREKVAM